MKEDTGFFLLTIFGSMGIVILLGPELSVTILLVVCSVYMIIKVTMMLKDLLKKGDK